MFAWNVFILPLMLEDTLKQIGFSDKESRVYLELLSIGPQPVSVLARRLSVNRTTTYSVLKILQAKGIVSSFLKSEGRIFVANDPNSLVGFFDRKCQQYEYCRSTLLSKVGEFRALAAGPHFSKPMVVFHDGIEAMKFAAKSSLANASVLCACLNPEKWMNSELRDFFEEMSGCEMLNKLFYLAGNEMLITDDRVIIFNLERSNEYAVVLKDPAIALMHRVIFDLAYRACEGDTIKL